MVDLSSISSQFQSEGFQYYKVPYIIFAAFLILSFLAILLYTYKFCTGSIQPLVDLPDRDHLDGGEHLRLNEMDNLEDRGSQRSIGSRANAKSVKRRMHAMQDEDW